jgi:hypothetical protein
MDTTASQSEVSGARGMAYVSNRRLHVTGRTRGVIRRTLICKRKA